MVTLLVSRAGKAISTTQLGSGLYVVGRDRDCDVVLDDMTASRKHARLRVSGDEVSVEDLDSSNGTFVAGSRIRKHRLVAGDVVAIGEHRLAFEGLPSRGESAGSRALGTAGETAILSTLEARPISRGEDVRDGQVSEEALANRLSLFYRLGESLCGRVGIPEIAETFVGVLLEAFPRADRAMLLLGADARGELQPVAARERCPAGGDVRVSSTVAEAVLGGRRSVLCSDTLQDERFKDARSLLDLRLRSIMCVPLLAGDKVLGMAEVDCLGGAGMLDVDDLRLLTGLASQVAISIENAGLYGEIERSRRLAAIGQAVAGAAHCVKNVLNGVEGGLFIARRGLETKDEEKTGKGWEMLERNSAFLKTMVLDMLDYSKERTVEYEDAAVADLLGEVVTLVEGRAAETGVTVSLSIDPSLGRVTLDAKRIKRALLNIVSNAVEATPAGGSVTISASPEAQGMFAMRVTDTGGGIAEDLQARIFEPFYSTKGSKGTGLGLSVAKKIIEEHRGKIDIESRLGAGTTFSITLPL